MECKPPHGKGFTLIELMMVLAIVAVLLTLALPAFGKLVGRTHAQVARSQLITALNQARIAAVNRGARVVACPSSDQVRCDRSTQWHHGWLVFTDLDRDGDRSDGETVITVTQTQPHGVAILGTRGRPRVDFLPDGSASGSNLSLTLCDRATGIAGASAVIVSQSGRVRHGPAKPAAAADCLEVAG
jgi:type IV fimbrial biogenesis protein FimT